MYLFYSRPDKTGVRVTVAGEYREGVLQVAVSRCSKQDQFQKKIGRAIAGGRLLKGKVYAIFPKESCNSYDFVEIARKVADSVTQTKTVGSNSLRL